MLTKTKRLYEKVRYAIDEADLISAGTCACMRPHPRFITCELRALLDELDAAVLNEPETRDWSRNELLEVDKKEKTE